MTTTAPSLVPSLLEAVEGHDASNSSSHQPLVDLFMNQHPMVVLVEDASTARAQRTVLLTTVETLDKRQARRFFVAVGTILGTIVEEELFVPESAYDEENEFDDETPKEDTVSDAEAALALEFVKVTALCMESYMTSDARATTTGKMLDEVHTVMLHLHNSLLCLQAAGDDGVAVQSKICSLCECWWKNDWKDRDDFVVQLLPILVAKSVDKSATKADIKRLYQMRRAFDVLDFADESSQDIKNLLLRTLSSPLYLQEGKPFVAYLYQHMPHELHQAMRAQIPNAKKAVLEAYGEILFRAWKDGESRLTLEDVILKDFTYAIIHVGNAAMIKSLHVVLGPIHQAKTLPEVDQLLHRLYGPILWRSLRAANAHVRVHSASVLAQVFPLADGVNMQKAVQKAVAALQALLMDTVPSVREAGSTATATVLATYWDALPAAEIRLLLKHVLDRHACDVSSSAVRAGAVNAIAHLLDAPQSHAVLRERLPGLGNLIHDKVERVRVATVKLLQKIKTSVPDIKYYKVVPVEHLWARLEQDARNRSITNPMTSALTNLMKNSYFPQNSNGSEQVHRTLKFLNDRPLAAAVFYANLSKHLAVNSVSKLVTMLLKWLEAAVEQDSSTMQKNKKRRYGKVNDDEGSSFSAQNTALMASLAETICCLWESVRYVI
jgi:condensin-2 complex subunit G2